jgi:hypothetical protein
VRFTDENEGVVLYEVSEPYPATSVIESIAKRLHTAGWSPRPEDFLNPGIQLSFSTGGELTSKKALGCMNGSVNGRTQPEVSSGTS